MRCAALFDEALNGRSTSYWVLQMAQTIDRVFKDSIQVGYEVPSFYPSRRLIRLISSRSVCVVERFIITLGWVTHAEASFPAPCESTPDDGRENVQGIRRPEESSSLLNFDMTYTRRPIVLILKHTHSDEAVVKTKIITHLTRISILD